MAEQLLNLELVTPEALGLSGEVEMVVVPGALGDMGILAWHAPIISQLRPGVIDVYRGGQVTHRYFTAGGYVEVHDNLCTILAEELIEASSLNRVAIETEITGLKGQFEQASDEGERERLQKKIDRAEAQKLAAAA